MNKLQLIKGVGFDLDGTLVDTLPSITKAVSTTLRQRGHQEPSLEEIKVWIGEGVDNLLKTALIWSGVNEEDWQLPELKKEFYHFYQQYLLMDTYLYPGVAEALWWFSQIKKLKLALISNKPYQFITPLLEELKIINYFSIIVGGDSLVVCKPHPAPIYYSLAKLGLLASELVFVGDSKNDILSAQAAGCSSVGVTYGYNYNQAIELSQPDYTISHFNQLTKLFETTFERD